MTTRPVLLTADVARLWSEETGTQFSTKTVTSYRTKSKPADPANGRPNPGRYAKIPVPKEDGYLGEGARGNQPYWLPEREEELRLWPHCRPGIGGGGTELTLYKTLAELAEDDPELAEEIRQRMRNSRASRAN